MNKAMEKIYNACPKRNLGRASAEVSIGGRIYLELIPTHRGASMFYRRDWCFNGERIKASDLIKMDMAVIGEIKTD